MTSDFTIAAISTPPGNGGIGILRISGPQALEAARKIAPSLPSSVQPRHAYYSPFVDAQGEPWDVGLVLYFQGPKSFTGEDVVELHAHGSSFLLQKLLSWVLSSQVRLAEPGEFTRRAFLNGRLKLTQAEAVADLIRAESDAAVRSAASQLSGTLQTHLEAWYDALLSLRTDVEASLDFPQEADGAEEGVGPRLEKLHRDVAEFLSHAHRGQFLRRGIRVVLFGPVNAGKSTLFNALCGEARALVDETPGTTRDVLEAKETWKGLSVTWVDTAGLREISEAGKVERMGMEKTFQAVRAADLAVLVRPLEASDEMLALWRRAAEGVRLLEIQGKGDVVLQAPSSLLAVSGQTGLGVDALRDRVVDLLWGDKTVEASAWVSERHADALRRVEEALTQAKEASVHSTLEAVAGELSFAQEALAEIVGNDVSADLLDAIFQRFCIGK